MTTNAQASLQAAATIYSESKGYASVQTIQGMAAQFKRWLDAKDKEDLEALAPKVEESMRTPANHTGLPSSEGHPDTRDYLYEVDMTPRNQRGALTVTVEVWAADHQQAISKALSVKPGHIWGDVRQGQPSPPKPAPPRTEQQWLGNSR